MKLDKDCKVEKVCDRTRPGSYGYREPLARPWLKGGNLYATDTYRAVRIPVEVDPDDTDGVVPVEAIKSARASKAFRNECLIIMLNGEARTLEASYPRPEVDTVDIEQLVPAWADGLEDAPDTIVTLRFNAKFLAELASALGTDTVTVRVDTAAMRKPIVVNPSGAAIGPDKRLGLLMPLSR